MKGWRCFRYEFSFAMMCKDGGKTFLSITQVSYSEAPAQPAENGLEAEAEESAIDIEVEEAR